MIKLGKKLVIFFLLILAVNQVMKKILLPYAWADNVLTQKIKGYKEPNDQYNTLFLGASLTYRHIDPYIIDSIAHLNGLEVHSYNLAVDAQNFVKILDNFEYSKTIQNPHLEYVFIELSSSMEMYLPALHTVKNFYWIEFHHVLQAAGLIKEFPVNKVQKALYGYAYGVSWLENLLSFGAAPDVLRYYFSQKKNEKYFIGKNKNGFYPYSLNSRFPLMGTSEEEKMIFEERRILMENPDTIISALKQKAAIEYNRGGGKKIMKNQLNILLNLIAENNSKGIKTIYILPPRARGNYNILLPLFRELPADNKIDLGNPNLYPEFYTIENSFNFFHFNQEGAEVYSKVLGQKVVELLQ